MGTKIALRGGTPTWTPEGQLSRAIASGIAYKGCSQKEVCAYVEHRTGTKYSRWRFSKNLVNGRFPFIVVAAIAEFLGVDVATFSPFATEAKDRMSQSE